MNLSQQIVRDACIKANPSILNLEFGCEYESEFTYKGEHTIFRIPESGYPGKNNKIIGRPIRLADVLLAIWKKTPSNKTKITVESDGQFLVFNPLLNQRFAKQTWNLLKDDLSQQSQETMEFLAGLLSDNT